MDVYIATLTEWEDPDEYKNLLDRLAEDYQPVGAAEGLEVQRIAMCWWKISRVWRYENAQIAVKLCARHAELKLEAIPSEDQARLVLLKNAELEIEATGRISDELKGKMFADREFGKLWESVEAYLNEFLARRIGLPSPMMREVIERKSRRTQAVPSRDNSACGPHYRARERVAYWRGEKALQRHRSSITG